MALEAREIAQRLSPDDPNVWNTTSFFILKLGHHEQALEASDKALNLTPDYPEAFQSKGMAIGGLGRREEAREWLSRAWDAREHLPDKGAEVKEKLRELGHDSEEDG